jgi:hypothetical protein
MTDAPRLDDGKPEEALIANHPRRRRMTRREIWTQIGVSAAAWVMLFALARIWWRVYLVVNQ